MPLQKNKTDDERATQKERPMVVVHARPMDEHQERRLTTAVDALLTEWVRQEMGRAKRQP